MAVEVRLTSLLQRLVGAKSVMSEGTTVGELLANLDAAYPGFKDIRYLGAFDTPLQDGDVVSILPALAGGV